jgi:hypothetical protein
MAGKRSRPGERRGGLKKGTPNKATTAASIQAEIVASGEKPLNYMLRVMRDETAEPVTASLLRQCGGPCALFMAGRQPPTSAVTPGSSSYSQ